LDQSQRLDLGTFLVERHYQNQLSHAMLSVSPGQTAAAPRAIMGAFQIAGLALNFRLEGDCHFLGCCTNWQRRQPRSTIEESSIIDPEISICRLLSLFPIVINIFLVHQQDFSAVNTIMITFRGIFVIRELCGAVLLTACPRSTPHIRDIFPRQLIPALFRKFRGAF
jgi:hypothetical protein